MAGGSFRVSEITAEQPLASVTTRVYAPAGMALRSSETALFDHTNSKGGWPPLTLTSIAPVATPAQSGMVNWEAIFKGAQKSTDAESTDWQPLLSVTSTV